MTDLANLKRVIAELPVDEDSRVSASVQRAVQLARRLQERGGQLQTPQEKRQQSEFERMMHSEQDKATLAQLTDQAFRSASPRRAADQLTHILDVQGIPRFFSMLDRAMLRGFQSFGGYLPGVSVPMVKEKMRAETANVILPAEPDLLSPHLRQRREHGLRMNVNYLGEALLGEQDAQARLQAYLASIQQPAIEVISVKVSTLYSQITPIARKAAVTILCERLERLYRAAQKAQFKRADGSSVSKFVYLDMEEYRDLSVTVQAFTETLDRPGLEQANAGIALQAYIPDSYQAQQRINEWARRRVAAGGRPVTIRLVKGANMETERAEASLAGWPQAPFNDKVDTDANYKRMLHEALLPDNIAAVHLGVASHNLFEVAYALVLATEADVLDKVQFEMLEGMANHQRRALQELTSNLLLYAPATSKQEFTSAIGYLIRRLDENTGPENFLRYAYKLEVGGEIWNRLEAGFLSSLERMSSVSAAPRRQQNRQLGEPEAPVTIVATADFVNEPDTDFSLDANLAWADAILDAWRERIGDAAPEIPLVIGGQTLLQERAVRTCNDPSRPDTVVARYRQASESDIDNALACARKDPAGWRQRSPSERAQILNQVALELRKGRADLMGAALADGGKLLTESDPEISEAIDFAVYYAATAQDLFQLDTVEACPKGVVVVVPPWNFPIAIPCGGVSAALAAGNTVILKPASDTVLVAYELCKCFWRAGVPKETLQFAPCSGAKGGAQLVASEEVDAVILTGGTNTALRMLQARPAMTLLAETGGKNATIVTSMSDRDQAIKHVLHSAFGHSGQKCSATSLLILEREVYEDERFRKTFCDAVRSLRVGSAWDLATKVGPLVSRPDEDLERGLKDLEDGESWAVMAIADSRNAHLYSPAVKWGVSPGSYSHLTEFFGPVLSVMCADDIEHAIELVNQTGYGLTSGLESLDTREQDIFRETVRAGNLYINRGTTGAVVLRQPFGGMGKSAFGPGIKAGGPNYVAQLMSFRDRAPSSDDATVTLQSSTLSGLKEKLQARAQAGNLGAFDALGLRRLYGAMASYDQRFSEIFSKVVDDVKLVGQDNLRRYRPARSVRVRIHPDDTAFEIFARVCAARLVGCHVAVSTPEGFMSEALTLLDEVTESWAAGIEFVEETDDALATVVAAGQSDRIRYAAASRVPKSVLEAITDNGVFIARYPVLAEGRIELLWYLTEQSISLDYHRYGNLGKRSGETRRPVS